MKGFQHHLELWWHHVEWQERLQLRGLYATLGSKQHQSDVSSDTPRQCWGSHLPTCTAGGWEEPNSNELWTQGLRSEAATQGAGQSCGTSREQTSEEENRRTRRSQGWGGGDEGTKCIGQQVCFYDTL